MLSYAQTQMGVTHAHAILAIICHVMDRHAMVSLFFNKMAYVHILEYAPVIYLLNIIDIDECAEGADGCAQTCTNEVGSYSCSCGSGYRLATNRHGCSDIDECAEGSDGCDQTCTNSIGSYVCSCESGYRLASDGHMCNGESLPVE